MKTLHSGYNPSIFPSVSNRACSTPRDSQAVNLAAKAVKSLQKQAYYII